MNSTADVMELIETYQLSQVIMTANDLRIIPLLES